MQDSQDDELGLIGGRGRSPQFEQFALAFFGERGGGAGAQQGRLGEFQLELGNLPRVAGDAEFLVAEPAIGGLGVVVGGRERLAAPQIFGPREFALGKLNRHLGRLDSRVGAINRALGPLDASLGLSPGTGIEQVGVAGFNGRDDLAGLHPGAGFESHPSQLARQGGRNHELIADAGPAVFFDGDLQGGDGGGGEVDGDRLGQQGVDQSPRQQGEQPQAEQPFDPELEHSQLTRGF